MYASDLYGTFWDLGYSLFRDKDKMHAKFIQADIFASSSPLHALTNKMDIILIIEHDLLPISFCFSMVHASIMGFALDFIERFAVVRKNAQKRGTPRSGPPKHEQLQNIIY